DFELVQECLNDTKEYINVLNLIDITGEAGTPFNLLVFKSSGELENNIEIPADFEEIELVGISFLQTPDRTFTLRLTQTQSTCTTPLSASGLKSLEIPEQPEKLEVTIRDIKNSIPDVGGSNGSFNIFSVTGGVAPYNAVLEGDAFGFVTRGPDEIPFNTTSARFTLDYDGLGIGDYDLFVTDNLGCEIEVDVEIPLDSTLFIPNVITPNGDDINDYFVIRNLDLVTANQGATLVITSRWGKQIYSSNNYTNENPWGGDEAAEGLFFYKLEAGGKVYTGWLEVIFGGSP
ncbi:MAG: gliding motility-associated C-terminal domain-containing protein, partial [Fulvivirga sp.]